MKTLWTLLALFGATSVVSDEKPNLLHITTPDEAAALHEEKTVVVGRVSPEAPVSVNGAEAVVGHGTFLVNGVPLALGENTLAASATFEKKGKKGAQETLTDTRHVVRAPLARGCSGFAVFGPRGFLRLAGQPTWESHRFSAEAGEGYVLRVRVGDDVRTSHAVAEIELNGRVIFSPGDFHDEEEDDDDGDDDDDEEDDDDEDDEKDCEREENPHQPFTLERSVSLAAENELRVRLRGKPGAFLIATVLRTEDAAPPLSLEVTSPPEGSFLPSVTVDVRGKVTAESARSVRVGGVDARVFPDGSFEALGVPLPEEGLNELSIVAEDLCGRELTQLLHLVRDTTLPLIRLTAPEEGSFENQSQRIAFEAEDVNLESLSATLDGEPFESGGEVAEEDEHDLVVTARDKAGNVASESRRFTLDFTAPTLSFFPLADAHHKESVTPSVSAADLHLDRVEITLNGELFRGETVSAERGYLLSATAFDLAENQTSDSISFVIDLTPPTIDIRGVTEGEVTRGTVVPEVSITDLFLARQEILLNGNPYVPGTPVDAEDDYRLDVEAEDRARNVSSDSVSFAIDRTAPVIVFPPGLDGLVTREAVTASASASDPHLLSLETFLDGMPFVNGGVVDSEDEYIFEARAKDRAENAAFGSVSFAIDRTPPSIDIEGIPGRYFCGAVTPEVEVSDLHPGTVNLFLDGLPLAPGTPITSERDHVLRVEAVDAAENPAFAEKEFTIDCTLPVVSIESPSENFLTNQTEVTVTGEVLDLSPIVTVLVSGVPAVVQGSRFTAVVGLGEGPNVLVAIATDAAQNAGSEDVSGRLDTVLPTVSVSGPSQGRRGQEVLVVAEVSDDVELASVRFSVDGVDAAELFSPPFEHRFTVPATAAGGSSIPVRATARDRAGNVRTSLLLSVRVVAAGGFLRGESYDGSRGLPLAGVTVRHSGLVATTDVRGRVGFATEESEAQVVFEKEGFTRVERAVFVDPVEGTLLLDARLTPLSESVVTLGPVGGAVSSERFSLEVPPDALVSEVGLRLTEVPSHGLRFPLPPGWSPVGSVQVDPEPTHLDVPAEIRLEGSFSGLDLALVRYDSTIHAWRVEASGLTGSQSVSSEVSSGGAYAFVVGDQGLTSPSPAEVGEVLKGVEVPAVSVGLSAASSVEPQAMPVSEDAKATGKVTLFSAVPLPSGAVVSAEVEESFDTLGEGELRSQPFTQEIPLYRFPESSDGELHAEFPVTPSRAFTAEELIEGKVHVAIRPALSFLEGNLVDEHGAEVSGEGEVSLSVPSGALPGTTAISVAAVDLLEVDPAPSGLTLLSAVRLDLSGRTLSSPATLSIAAPALSDRLVVGRFLNVQGLRKLSFVGEASRVGGRFEIGGIASEATYLFFESAEAFAVVRGVVREGGSPARLAVVESSTSPFMDITGDEGLFTVAAALRASTITARSLVSGNTGMKAVSPASSDPITADIDLAATGPFVSSSTPSDEARGVDLNPALRVDFSEPVRGVTSSSFFLRRKSGGALVSARIALGLAGRSASLFLESGLEPRMEYELVLTTDISDSTGNALLPETIAFTTKDDQPAEFDSREVSVSFPNPNGEVEVRAPPGAFEPFASVLLLNDTTGIVTSGEVDPEGGFVFFIRAAISDSLQIRILDSSGREIVIEKTEFHREDGAVAIGRKGGTISVGDITLEVPEGALSSASIFRLTAVDQAVIDALPLAEAAGGFGAGVEIDMGGTSLSREAELSFPVPASAPAEADFAIVRKRVEGTVTLYEVIDSASVKDGNVTTDSYPFLGVLDVGFYLTVWYPKLPDTGKTPVGAITGMVRETDSHPVNPTVVALGGATVRRVALPGQEVDGSYVTTSREDGRFVLFDSAFGTTDQTVDLVARHGNREVEARAFEDAGLFAEFVNLNRYNNAGNVVFNFDLTPPPDPPGDVAIGLFKKENDQETEITNGFAVVGDELVITVRFTAPTARENLAVNGETLVLARVDELNFRAEFTAVEARAYRVEVSAFDAFLRNLVGRKSFVALAGGGNDKPLRGPPSVITDASTPRPGETGVPINQTITILFTEPVTHVTSSTVVLKEKSTQAVLPLELLGTGPGFSGEVKADSVITALTARPMRGLKFSTDYELLLTGDIVDIDEDPPGTPAPNPLAPDPTVISFTSFTPEKLGEVSVSAIRMAMVTIGDRAFVASTPPTADGSFGDLLAYDLSDPTRPEKIGGDGALDSRFIGSLLFDMAGEERVDVGYGQTDLVAVLSNNPRNGNSAMTVFDVGGAAPPFPYAAIVTTNIPGEGFAAGLDLHREFAYVAAGNAGLFVVNLAEAVSAFRENSEPPHTSFGFEASRQIFTRGLGFARESIVRRIRVDDGGTSAHVSAVKVGATAIGKVAFAGSFADARLGGVFSTIRVENPFDPTPVMATLALERGALRMGFPSDMELTAIGGRELAVVAGGAPVGGTKGTLAVVDVNDPASPVVLSVIELEGSWGGSLAIDEDGDTVFVGVAEGVESYNLSDPENPQFGGRIEGLGAVAVAHGALVSAGAVSKEAGVVKTVALRPTAIVREVSPIIVYTDDEGRTVEPVRVRYQLIAPPRTLSDGEIQVLRDNEVVGRTPVQNMTEGTFDVTLPAGLVLDPPPEAVEVQLRLPDGRLTDPLKITVTPPDPVEPSAGDIAAQSALFEAISPNQAERGSAGIRVTVTGQELGSLSTVHVRGADGQWAALDVTSGTATELTFDIPASLMMREGFLQVSPVPSFEAAEALAFLVSAPGLPPPGSASGLRVDSVFPEDLVHTGRFLNVAGTGFTEGMAVVVGRGNNPGLPLVTLFESETILQGELPADYVGRAEDLFVAVLTPDRLRLSNAVGLQSSGAPPPPDRSAVYGDGEIGVTSISGEIVWNDGERELAIEGVGLVPGMEVLFTARRGSKVVEATETTRPSPQALALGTGTTSQKVPVPAKIREYPTYSVLFSGTVVRVQPFQSAPTFLVPQQPFQIPFGGRRRFTAYRDVRDDGIRVLTAVPRPSNPEGVPLLTTLFPNPRLIVQILTESNDVEFSVPQNPTVRVETEASDPNAVYLRGIKLTKDPDTGQELPKVTIQGRRGGKTATVEATTIEAILRNPDYRCKPASERPCPVVMPAIDKEIVKVANRFGVPPQYLKAQVEVESSFVKNKYRYEPLTIDMKTLTGDGTIRERGRRSVFRGGQEPEGRWITQYPYVDYVIGTPFLQAPDTPLELTQVFEGPGYEGKRDFFPTGCDQNPVCIPIAAVERLPRPGNYIPVTVTVTKVDGVQETYGRVFEESRWSPRHGTIDTGRQPQGREFNLDYTAGRVRLGTPLGTGEKLTIKFRPVLLGGEVTPGKFANGPSWGKGNNQLRDESGLTYNPGRPMSEWLQVNLDNKPSGAWLICDTLECEIQFDETKRGAKGHGPPIDPRLGAVNTQFYAAASFGVLQLQLGNWTIGPRQRALDTVLKVQDRALYETITDVDAALSLGAVVHVATRNALGIQLDGNPCNPCDKLNWETTWADMISRYNPDQTKYRLSGGLNAIVRLGRDQYEPQ